MKNVTPADRQALLNLILEVSFERKDVTLASGKKSKFYLDLRQTLMRPKGVSLAGRLVLDLLQTGPPVEAVGGMAVGAVLEGGFKAGQTVALVEDTTTTGGSTLDALDLVEAAGGKVARVICLVDRGEGAVEAFAERGVTLEAIFHRDDLPI